MSGHCKSEPQGKLQPLFRMFGAAADPVRNKADLQRFFDIIFERHQRLYDAIGWSGLAVLKLAFPTKGASTNPVSLTSLRASSTISGTARLIDFLGNAA